MKFLTKNIKINTILLIGIVLTFLGILFLACYFSENPHTILLFRGVFIFILGAGILFLEINTPKRTWFMFMALLLMFSSVIFVICDIGFLSASLGVLWPCFVIIFGIMLLPFSYYKTKKIKAIYFVPAFVITGFGICFMMFTLDVIKKDFVEVASKWWPVLLILSGIILIGFFFWQQYNIARGKPELAVEDNSEEENTEEEIVE